METAATYAVAQYLRMDRASLLFAFDNPRQKEHLFLDDAQKQQRRAIGNQRMIELALEVVQEYARVTLDGAAER
jgi:purine-nucleoside phosphorylase